MSGENVVQQNTRLHWFPELSPHGQMWRNNSGAYTDETGRSVRYGLGNDSKKVNKEIKSSDLIGIVPTLITPEMVGYYLGVFTALEMKPDGWTFHPEGVSEKAQRERAQDKYHQLVRAACGYAGFVTCRDDLRRIIGR